MEPDEAAQIIEEFLTGTGGRWDWDDFTSVRYKHPLVEIVRQQCAELPSKYPPLVPGTYCAPEGLEELRKLVKLLREQTK